MVDRLGKKGFWRIDRRTARELFMNNVHRGGKKGVLANSSANSSLTDHEQCSSDWAKRDYGDKFGEQFAKCSWTMFARLGKKRFWRKVRRTVRELFMNSVRQTRSGELTTLTIIDSCLPSEMAYFLSCREKSPLLTKPWLYLLTNAIDFMVFHKSLFLYDYPALFSNLIIFHEEIEYQTHYECD